MDNYINVLKKYAVFSGRARRKEYWLFQLFHAIFIAALYMLIFLGILLDVSVLTILFGVVFVAYAVVTLIPILAVGVRRLHDSGRSGLWMLIMFVPFGGIVLLIFFLLDSQPGWNQYGPNPKFPTPAPRYDRPGYQQPYPPQQ